MIGIGILFGCNDVWKMSISGRFKVSFYFRGIPERLCELNVHGNIIDDFNRNCTSLRCLCLSEVRVFGRWSFYRNTGLVKAKFCDVSNIGEWSFAHCERLKEVDLPSSVIQIGMNSFRGCFGLSRIVLRANRLVTIGANALYSTDEKVIVVPEELMESYSEDKIWSEYTDHLESILRV